MGEAGRNARGIRIRTVNMVMLGISLVLFCIVLYTTVQIAWEYEKHVATTEKYIQLQQSAHLVHSGSDYLTEQARLYAISRRLEHVANYFDELYSYRNREKALDFIKDQPVTPEQKKWLQDALTYSNKLTGQEIRSIRLVAEATHQDLNKFPRDVQEYRLDEHDSALDDSAKMELARNLLFSPAYWNAKEDIYGALNQFLEETLDRTHMEQRAQSARLGDVLSEQRLVLFALCCLNVLTFVMIMVLIVKPLQIYLKCIKDDRMIEIVGAYEFRHLALTYNDIFAMKEHHDRLLRHKAEHDPLTGLFNRGAFEKFRALLQMDESPVGLALIDVDKFKSINDTFGHEAGDRALRRVADQLRRNFRSDDFCIRMGGDEFAVIVKGQPENLRPTLAEKIRHINRELARPDGDTPACSLSVGVAFSCPGFTDDLYGNADAALYAVKERGRNGLAFFDEISVVSR